MFRFLAYLNMFVFGLIYVCSSALEWPGVSHYSSQTRKMPGFQLRLLWKSFPGPLLKSGVRPLARYGNHQEIINRRPEQMHTSSDTKLELPREGPLFESDSNNRRGFKTGPLFESLPTPRPLLKSGLQPLDRYGTCQETIGRRLEQMHTPSDTGFEWLGEGPSVVWWSGGRGGRPPQWQFFRGGKIRNCQCEISYKICKVQLVNKFKVVVILAFL